jgi:hypothetical protein
MYKKELILYKIYWYTFNSTDVTGKLLIESEAALALLMITATEKSQFVNHTLRQITNITLQFLITCNFSLVEIFEGLLYRRIIKSKAERSLFYYM